MAADGGGTQVTRPLYGLGAVYLVRRTEFHALGSGSMYKMYDSPIPGRQNGNPGSDGE